MAYGYITYLTNPITHVTYPSTTTADNTWFLHESITVSVAASTVYSKDYPELSGDELYAIIFPVGSSVVVGYSSNASVVGTTVSIDNATNPSGVSYLMYVFRKGISL